MTLDDDALMLYAERVGRRIASGKVIPFLGAGANLCDRPADADWRDGDYLPDGGELAEHLATAYRYPGKDRHDLVRIAQYVDLVTGGDGALFDELRPVFAGDHRPNSLHRYLAELPARQLAAGTRAPYQLIVTTNYDDLLERAFAEAGQAVDVVYYASEEDAPGTFVHLTADGRRVPITVPATYVGLDLSVRPAILKAHGAVDRDDAAADSYVITEDHYIDYLAHSGVERLLPAYLMARMTNSHFLFLGYAMRDWNLRVILHYVWSQQNRRFGSWAIDREPDPIDQKFWERHRVEIVSVALDEWVKAMARTGV